jgi:hypothetical protein
MTWTARDICALQGGYWVGIERDLDAFEVSGEWAWAGRGVEHHAVAWLRERRWFYQRPFLDFGGRETDAARERDRNMMLWGVKPGLSATVT